MQLSRFSFVLATIVCVPLANAQGTDNGKKVDDNQPSQAEVRFTDESVVRMSILQDKVDIATKYGKLTIPIADIIKIDFGIHVPPELEKQIAKAIEDLGSENYKARELALKELVTWGPYAYPQVYKASKIEQPLEVKKRAQLALEKLRAKHPAHNLRLREDDIITTPNFTIVGRVTTPTVKAKAENFGELDLQLTKLRGIRWMFANLDLDLVVDAAKHAIQGQWLDTGFEVKQETKLVITATGTVNSWPQNGGYISGPKGLGNDNFGGPRGAQAPGIPFAPGALVGRVGTDGPMFLVGERYEGAPGKEGKLFLHIGASPWQPNSSIGTYAVKILPKSEYGD